MEKYPGVQMSQELQTYEPALTEIIEANKLISMEVGSIDVLGPLASPDARRNWHGNISLDQRIKSGELTQEDIAQAIENLGKSFVECDDDGSTRCIDGRFVVGYDDRDPRQYGRPLGPQVPGGDLVMVFSGRIARGAGNGGQAEISYEEDLKEAIYSPLGRFTPGNHFGENHPEDKTGCVAFDGEGEHLAAVTDANLDEILGVEKALLGENFSQDAFNRFLENRLWMMSEVKDYLKNRDAVLKVIEQSNPDGLPLLGVTPHNEFMVNINTVEGTTLHKDHFNSYSDGRLQVFNYDIWRTFGVENDLYADDPIVQQNYLHTRIALAVSALMHLTDGSLLLSIRRAREVSSADR